MKIQREHISQGHLRKWIEEALDCEHLFIAFDAAKKSSAQAWQREKARGVLPGCPDSLLIVKDVPPIWIEWKAPGGKPTDVQLAVGGKLHDIGHHWFWASEIRDAWRLLHDIGVPMRANAEFLAELRDAKAAGQVAKKEIAKGKRPRVRKAEPRYQASKRLAQTIWSLT